MDEVVARAPARLNVFVALLVVNLMQLALWGPQLVRDPDPLIGLLVAFLLVSALVVGAALLVARSVELVLDRDTLRLVRRWRPLVIPRTSVRAVRGSVPGRPSWSDAVLLDVDGRTVRLPTLEPSPAILVPRLQTWAGVGEAPVDGVT